MKKTLIALGVLAALPSLALSAEVSIYGKVDVGLAFVNVGPGVDGQDSWSNLSMQSGQTAGSRVGMTGFEELGNGHKVGFILENGFNVDNGAMGQDFWSSGTSLLRRSIRQYQIRQDGCVDVRLSVHRLVWRQYVSVCCWFG